MKTKVSLFLRLKFAWKAFYLTKRFEYEFPLEYYCNLIHNAGVCDNNRRISKCTNEATIALSNPTMLIEFRDASYYHVCKDCAKIYISTQTGETFG